MNDSPQDQLQSQLEIVDKALQIINRRQSRSSGRSPLSLSPNKHQGRQRLGTTLQSSRSLTVLTEDSATEFSDDLRRDSSSTKRSHQGKSVASDQVGVEDRSYVIETSGTQGDCGRRFNRKMLKYHLSYECPVATTRNQLILAGKQREEQRLLDAQRLAEEAMKRALSSPPRSASNAQDLHQLNSSSQSERPTFQTCPHCDEQIPINQYEFHLYRQCQYRPVLCPHFGCGCSVENIPMMALAQHLEDDCPFEKYREALIAQSKERRIPVQCSTCGEMIPLIDLKKHEQRVCPNRLVACRNHTLGCPVRMPRKERHVHECADNVDERICLYLNGGGGGLMINETDISGPWTVEYWIYRPFPEESLKLHIQNILLQLPPYLLAYESECIIKDKVAALVIALRQDPAKNPEVQQKVKEMSKAERIVWQQEYQQQRMNLVNDLTALIGIYQNSVLAYLRAFQAMATGMEAAMDCLYELSINRYGETQKHRPFSLTPDTLGRILPRREDSRHYAQALRPVSSSTNAASSVLTGSVAIGGGNSSVAEEEDKDGEDSATEMRSEQSQSKRESFGNSKIGAMDSEYPGLDAEQIRRRVEVFTSSNTSDVALICKQCAMIEATKRLESVERLIEAQQQATVIKASPADEATEQANPDQMKTDETSASGEETEETEEAEDEEKKDIESQSSQRTSISIANSNPPATIAQVHVTSSPHPSPFPFPFHFNTNGLSEFLWDFMVQGDLAVKKHLFVLSVWSDLVYTFSYALKMDFDRLQDWRIEFGLLTPENRGEDGSDKKSRSNKRNNDKNASEASEDDIVTDKKDENVEKQRQKEKARRRREQKKKQGQEDVDEEEGRQDYPNSSSNSTSRPEKRFIVRSSECLRSGCGVEILAESSSCYNNLDHRSRICVAMYSGLTILHQEMPRVDYHTMKKEDVNHHYELLVPSKEMKKLMNLGGGLGFLSVGMNNNIAAGTVDPKGSGPDTTQKQSAKTQHEADVLIHSYGLKIPRCKWTQIVLTVSPTPKNRVVFYMDGQYISTAHDCAFALPMLTIGGSSSSLHTFRGGLLDARYWSHVRSARTIFDFCHKLVRLESCYEGKPDKVNKSKGTSSPNQGNKPHKNRVQDSMVNDHGPEDEGLIGWWTFEDGPGHVTAPNDDCRATLFASIDNPTTSPSHQHQILVTDVTRHRFKTKFSLFLDYDVMIQGGLGNNQRYGIVTESLAQLPKSLMDLVPASMIIADPIDESKVQENELVRREWMERWANIRWLLSRPQWLDAQSLFVLKEQAASLVKVKNQAKENAFLDDPLPIPSYRARNICPFEVRRLKLAKAGRDLQRFAPCPLQCGEMIRWMVMRYHVRFDCVQRLIACRYEFCGAIFPWGNRTLHELKDCALITMRSNWLKEGKRNNQLVVCSLCSEEVKLRHLKDHQEKTCEQRLVYCPYPDCEYGQGVVETSALSNHNSSPQDGDQSTLLTQESSQIVTDEDDPQSIEQNNDQIGRLKRLPAHLLNKHLQFECTSAVRRERDVLVERSRSRHPYPRPWGICIAWRADMMLADSTNNPIEDPVDLF